MDTEEELIVTVLTRTGPTTQAELAYQLAKHGEPSTTLEEDLTRLAAAGRIERRPGQSDGPELLAAAKER